MRAVIATRHGGPEVLKLEEVDKPTLSATQILVEATVAGVNYLDVYQRSGATPLAGPFRAGVEGAGLVVDVGEEVVGIEVGTRVAWLSGGQGSYADFVAVEQNNVVVVPDDIPLETACAALMQGVTAQYLASTTHPVSKGDSVLVHAAAGGVGQLLTQVINIRGGRAIGTVSTPEKAQAAKAAGADEVVLYENFAAKVRDLTDGKGVAVVYDGVGAATFEGSLASLRTRGMLVIYGAASGPTPPIEVPRLLAGGSLFVTRPSVAHYTATRAELTERANAVFQWLDHGALRLQIAGVLGLDQVAEAQVRLESRGTTGKLLIRIRDSDV